MSEVIGRRTGTRGEIITAAMELFGERGYDKTSLREIAEVVGVTKAALYYHFPTKGDIVQSALQDYIDGLTELVNRAEGQPAGIERNTELVDQLLRLFSTTGGAALRFGQANPTVMSQLEVGEMQVTQIQRLTSVLTGGRPGAENTIRATLAFGALVFGTVGGGLDLPGTVEERRQAARAVALDLLVPLASPS